MFNTFHEVEQEMLKGQDAVDARLMELLEERGKKKVSHNYIEQIDAEAPKSKGMIPARPKEPPVRNELLDRIPPRARDGKTFGGKTDESTTELLNKLSLQNQKIINQNKIIIDLLTKIEEKL